MRNDALTETTLGDARLGVTAGAEDQCDAAWFLMREGPARLAQGRLAGPVILGLVIAILIVAMVVLSPSTDSHFIYTDF